MTGVAECVDEFERGVRERLGVAVFGIDDETLPAVTGRLLVQAGRTVATAESCTGGLLGGALTSVAGSSSWYRGGIVAYDDHVQMSVADIPGIIKDAHKNKVRTKLTFLCQNG